MSTSLARCVAAALFALVSCGPGAPLAPRVPAPALALQPLSSSKDSRRIAETRGPARSHLLGTIARKTIGPFAAQGHDGGIAAWIVGAERGGGQELDVVPFGMDGAPLRGPRVVASVPREATSLVVRSTGRTRGGWLMAWSALLDRGESLTVLELSQDGTVRGAPADVQRTSDHVAWADLVTTPRSTLCIWAEETATGDANLLAAPLDSGGRPHGLPVRVAREVERWAAVPARDGAALAIVTRDKSSTAGMLSWLRLDADGNALGPPSTVSKEPTVSSDLEVVPFEDGWLLGWTDRTSEDAQVKLAAVDAAGHVQGPKRAMDAVGGSSLVTMASGAAGIALAWEELHARTRPWRVLHLASVTTVGGLAAKPATSFDVSARAPTELISTEDGFALLATPVPSCLPRDRAHADGCPEVPTFVRYDAHLGPLQAEPMFVGETQAPATLAWGLRCSGDRCIALAATSEAPTPVFAVDLARRKSPFEAPMAAVSPVGAPRATGIITLASGQPYIDLAAGRIGDTTLVATLTNAGAASDKSTRRRGATIALRAFDGDGRPLGTASTLTSYAVPLGRVAIAVEPRQQEEAAVAWIARGDGDPHVHVARVDRRGRRNHEVQLTTAKGDASSIAIAWAGDGWLVAWVDSRDGNGEVYAAKLDRELNRAGPDQRITRAPGDAADVSLAVGGEVAWLAWSDPRESPREGVGDVYVARLRTRDGKRMGDELRVVATAAHSRSPEVVVLGDSVLVAWIEEAPPGVDAPGAAMLARLDAHGRIAQPPRALATAGEGRPAAIVLAASTEGARAIIARSARDGVTLDAVEISSLGEPGPPYSVVDLDAPPSFDVALALCAGALFYDDTGNAPGDHRIRRAAMSWQQ
jgi:hypothetical protein